MKKIKIFVASPGDVAEERNIVTDVVQELRRIVGGMLSLEMDIEVIRWETHTWPAIGADAQDVINKQISRYDIFVGIMWKHFGTPTKRAASGTGEEFKKAFNFYKRFKRPTIMFYFRTTPFYSRSADEIEQFGKVIKFRNKLKELGVYYWEYVEHLDFERNVREHLLRQILKNAHFQSQGKSKPKSSGRKIPKSKVDGRLQSNALKQLPAPVKVFLAHTRQDQERVQPIFSALKSVGFLPWMDTENLLPGQEWNREINIALKETDIMVYFVSKNSIGSTGYLQKELMLARSKGKIILPVRLDPVTLPSGLGAFQWVDVFSSEDIEKLITAIQRIAIIQLREKRKGSE